MIKKKIIIPAIALSVAVASTSFFPSLFSQELSAAEIEKIVYHPLNPLTPQEIEKTSSIIRASQYGSEDMYFPEIKLEEPDKKAVWNWDDTDGSTRLPRLATFTAIKGNTPYEGTVNLDQNKIVYWKEVTEGWPFYTEWGQSEAIVEKDPAAVAALAKRGYTDLSKIKFADGPLGDYGPELTPKGSRLAMSVPRPTVEGAVNSFAHPMDGLAFLVDLNAKKVLKIYDYGTPPIPTDPNDYSKVIKSDRTDQLKPLIISQPQGASFNVKGSIVDWQNWKFQFRLDPRVGPIISTVSYNDNGTKRKVMYEGYMGGMMVPYGDPDPAWLYKIFMDAGEYGVGLSTRSLNIGSDVPKNATLFDAALNTTEGKATVIKNAFALFERYADPEWSHNGDARERRELVLRAIATIGNYDYVLDWVFLQNGSVKIMTGATGLAQIKAVESKTIHDKTAEEDTRNGVLVDQNIVAPTHQHIFSYRLDLDVDGENNTVGEILPKAVTVPEPEFARSEMITIDKTYKTEQEAIQKFDPDKIVLVTSEDSENRQGYTTGYQVMPYAGGTHPFMEEPLFTKNDYVLKRAEFINNHIWVTPYKKDELYAEGKYTTHNTDTGLGLWTKKNRKIENTDTVVWLTTGTTHVMRAEEFPIMPTEWVTAMIKPFNFFDETPTLDLAAPVTE
ncbi:primary-amine oxidase [Paenibacillus phyllosphaerae]|uniref:Amine oxidase n=1 Tax=Paenibacillus phyllosphaerae TaxID=274593 RepID=A0A7W5B4P3_9BACL|nr:primary-amine oxidase [Paenibacillus phyllosphaerae]MBB3114352.1 primary-amine oxidase [Paenibacillus phyllosphaerae]